MHQKTNFIASYSAGNSIMPFFHQIDNGSENTDIESKPLVESQDESAEAVLAKVTQVVLDKSLEKAEESPIIYWMEVASPILKSGGKPVAIILALGFVSIPLMVTGSPWVALILAIGASLTAVYSCLL